VGPAATAATSCHLRRCSPSNAATAATSSVLLQTQPASPAHSLFRLQNFKHAPGDACSGRHLPAASLRRTTGRPGRRKPADTSERRVIQSLPSLPEPGREGASGHVGAPEHDPRPSRLTSRHVW
jgi:hypothetical protein